MSQPNGEFFNEGIWNSPHIEISPNTKKNTKSFRHQPTENNTQKKKHIFSLSFAPANRNFPLDSAARLVTAEVKRRSLKPLGSSPRITWWIQPLDPGMIFQFSSWKMSFWFENSLALQCYHMTSNTWIWMVAVAIRCLPHAQSTTFVCTSTDLSM